VARKISCRDGVYGGWEKAIEWLPKAGIKCMELRVMPEEELVKVSAAAKEKGVEILTLATGVDLDKPESIEALEKAFAGAQKIGVKLIFVSTKGEDRAAAMAKLRELGDKAAASGVTICMETHPPFCQNADGMLQTMADVNHPNVKINFDTANVFYYTEGLNSADELPRVVQHVASVHLKDTDGGFKSANFPVFGEGVVDFPRIFKTLDEAGFDGPLTMELEGPLVSGLDTPQRHEKVAACMDYLKSIGVV